MNKINYLKEIAKSDVVIIPYIDDQIRYVKSSNRIVDSLNMGRFVIMSKVEQFSEFSNFCYQGNIGNGLNWLKENKIEALKQLALGQKFVREKYNISKISNLWKEVIINNIKL